MGLKSIFKKAISSAIQYNFVWKILDSTLLQLARFIEWEHHLQTERLNGLSLEIEAIDKFCPNLIVKHGPFQGLKYPASTINRSTYKNIPTAEIHSVCGNLFPKLIGSFESELHSIITEIESRSYSEIINVGSAEGYYTIGFALKFPDAIVYSYDIKQEARDICQELSKLNQCRERIKMGEFCSPETLRSIPITKRGLIICDCEGYERELFIEEIVPHLKQCDLLIELHDFVNINISTDIKRRFENSHNFTTVKSIDDNEKARTYSISELENYDLASRKELLKENRVCIMEWIFLTPIDQDGE